MNSTPTTDIHGNVQWKTPSGLLHREDGPAVILIDGTQDWWVNGEKHRVDGPAVILPGYFQAWYLHNKLHRGNGPAVEWAHGYKEWWLNGKEYDQFKYWLLFDKRDTPTQSSKDML